MTVAIALEGLSVAGVSIFLLTAAFTDIRQRLIPNWVSLGTAACAGLYLAVTSDWVGAGLALGVAMLVFAAGFVAFVAGVFGGGDVKLLAATALFAGPAEITTLLTVMTVAGGVLSMAMLAARLMPLSHPPIPTEGRFAAVPYGVAIAAGGLFLIPTTGLI